MHESEVNHPQKVLNVWAIVLILWSIYRATFKSDLPIWFDEFIAKPFVFILPLYWFIVKYEHTSFLEGIGFKVKSMLPDILFGFGVGSIFIGGAFLTRMIKGLPLPPPHVFLESMIWILSSIMAASMEQVLSTGFVFKRLSERSKNIVRPLFVAAVLFFFLHIPALLGVDKISGSIVVQMMVLNTALSLTTSVVFLLRKNTIAPIIVHAFYLLSLPILL